MSRAHRYISYHHPGYWYKYPAQVARKAYEVYSAYEATKRVSRLPIAINSFSTGSDMPATPVTPARSRSRGRKRQRYQPYPKSKSRSAGRGTTPNPRSLSRLGGRSQSAGKAGKKVSFVPTHETGYVGRFAKAKVNKRKSASAYDKYGAVLKREENISGVTDAECVYVGHGFPVSQGVYQMFRALYRSLLSMAGYDFADWSDDFEGHNMLINITWSIGASSSVTGVNVNLGTSAATQSHYYNSTQIANGVATAVSDADALDAIQFQVATLNMPVDVAGVAKTMPLARINLNQYHVVLDYWSILKIKNVSLAEDASDGDLVTNVAAQPLVGKHYVTSEWKNGFQPVKETGGLSALVALPDSGKITAVAADWTATNQNTFRKPPPAYVFGTVKSATARINPGEVKSDVIKFKAKMLFNTLATKLLQNVNNLSNSGDLRAIGCASMFGLEREVKMGTETKTINVIAQIDFVLKVRGMARKSKVPPITTT